MKILYVTSTPLEYNSSANIRNIALIKGLIELGNEVSTISAEVDDNTIYVDSIDKDIQFEKRYWIKLGNMQSSVFNNIKDRNSYKSKLKERLYKIYTKFSIYDPKKRLIKNITKEQVQAEFDLMISSSDPKSSHLIAEKLIKLNPNITKKWIQYLGDPFIGDINKNTIIPKILIKKEEKRLITLCDKVIYVSPFTLKKQQETYGELKNKMKFVPIPYLKEKIYPEVIKQDFIIGYFGDYYTKDRNILPLYEVMSRNPQWKLNICGNSNIKLQEKDNIKVQGRQKLQYIESLEEKTDLLICVCNKYGTQIPGKIYHYAATNKPILILLDGENKEKLKEYFEEFDRFIICNNDKKEIEETIFKIINQKINYKPCIKLNSKFIAEKFINKIE